LPAQPLRHASSLEPLPQSAGVPDRPTAQALASRPGASGPVQGAGPAQALHGTAGRVIQTLQQAFGASIGKAIACELNLDPTSSHPVQACEVDRVLQIAQTAQLALQGVDFGSRLAHSACGDGPGFRRAAQSVGLEPGRIDISTRRDIDARMDARFNQAAATGQVPVPLKQVGEWLQNDLILLTK
jgi:hypothetical protein